MSTVTPHSCVADEDKPKADIFMLLTCGHYHVALTAVESALTAQGRKLMVADPNELKDDLVQDMIEVLTSFCARLYGRRSAKNKAKKALEVLQNEN
jgi:predicted site-specific integrase-resolvase